jgi:hypothetical protein
MQEFKTEKFNVRNLSYLMIKQEYSMNSENGFAIFEKKQKQTNTDGIELYTGNA